MTSENYEKLPEILKYNRELAEKFWKEKNAQKCLNKQNQLMASAYL